MNLLNPSKLPKPTVNHNCQTWFPNGYPWKGEFDHLGNWISGSKSIKLSNRYEVWDVKNSAQLRAEAYEKMKQKLGKKEFGVKELEKCLELPFTIATRVIEYAARRSEIKITGGTGNVFKYRFVDPNTEMTDAELVMMLREGLRAEFGSKQAVILLSGYAAPVRVRKVLSSLVIRGELQCENKKYWF